MKKNDKLVVLLGVIILIIASIGVWYWAPMKTTEGKESDLEYFVTLTGQLIDEEDLPSAVIVSDEDPFYALIATPLAINYDKECNQHVIPLMISNDMNKIEDSVNHDILEDLRLTYEEDQLLIDDSIDAKNCSLDIANKYWKSSEAALIIENNQHGYEIGLIATPFASYLGIPVIITDKIDGDVRNTLSNLGVRYTMICGENLEEYGNFLKFEDADQVINASLSFVEEKFKKADPAFEINYITVTNPIDAWRPEVIDEQKEYLHDSIKSVSMNRESTIRYLIEFLSTSIEKTFTIPEDFKYALIEIEGINHEVEGVEDYGDFAEFSLDPVEEGFNLAAFSTAHGIPVRDKNNIISDRARNEIVLYDCGGKEYSLSAKGSWTLEKEGSISAEVTIKKLDNPYYEMMEGLSSISPYLTSYHKGIIFAKPEFAFAADDEVRDLKGNTCPGFYLPGRNPSLVPMSNEHIYENIHEPLNKLLASLADIDYEKPSNLEVLREYYKDCPVYIALVGGTMAVPRYIYQNEVEPIGDIDGDGVDDTVAIEFGGGGTNSDNIYGNIDPINTWENQANDAYTKYPYLENIVGRITGIDAQDAAALVVRTIFYDQILNNEQDSEWKDNFANLNGAGLDFRKPFPVWALSAAPISKHIMSFIYKMSFGLLDFSVGPWKSDTGFGEITANSIEHEVGEELGFNVQTAVGSAAMSDGFTENALDEMKTTNLWNTLTFSRSLVEDLAGEGVVEGRDILEDSNFLWVTGHGCPTHFGMDGPDLVSAGYDGVLPLVNAPKLMQRLYKTFINPYFMVGFWGPGGGLGKVGEYNTRTVSSIDLNPSFMWLESCFCGKITGMYPDTVVGQSFLTSGVNSLVASTTGSNIPGGYLDPKGKIFDTRISTNRAQRQAEKKAEQDIYPDFHFGLKIYSDMCNNLKEDFSVGKAFRDAKNTYLPEDADWQLWWSPPLSASSAGAGSGYSPHMSAKYTSYHEYVLYGDPAFNPYMPDE